MQSMQRRTKIVTTLGPATDRGNTLERIILAGANVVRMNFSHGTPIDHLNRANKVREIAKRNGLHIAILGDLQGPKIRVSTFKEGRVLLSKGEQFILNAELAKGEGDKTQVGIDYKQLPQDVTTGDILLLDDGRVQLKVLETTDKLVRTEVTIGGPLSNNKGINKLGGGLTAPALTDKDRDDIKLAAKIGVDYLAVSFPRTGDDLHVARQLANDAGFKPQIVAKVERAEAVASDEALDDVILASDSVMVARGDLGVEIGDPELVGVQKKLISRARDLNRVVITATQMMETMITNPMPTRAEVMDVANAVLDGTDAVMLSGETATGQYPEETVKAMASVCIGAEKHPSVNISQHRMDQMFSSIEETVAMSAMYAANHLKGVKAIIALTESGRTAQMMSRITSGMPIIGLSRHATTLRKLALYRGVDPMYFDSRQETPESLAFAVFKELKKLNILQVGDLVILTKGDIMGQAGSTNNCKILEVK